MKQGENDDGSTPAPQAGPDERQVSSGRRRLLRSSLGAAPVVMTFVSQPVSATYVCKSASASMSANASRPAVSQCAGASGSWWRTHTGSWTGCSTSTRFDAYFSATTTYPAGTTMWAVLNAYSSKTSASDKLARNLIAALLNSKSTGITNSIGPGVFDDAQLKKMWVDGISGGYVPAPGVAAWNASGLNGWLNTVFPCEV